MARFSNTPSIARPGPTNIQGVAARTHEGGLGFVPGDPHVELFNAAVSGMLADQFYESGDARIKRLVELVPRCDPVWLQGFIAWLRDTANMRSASIVVAAEYARAKFPGGRQVVASALMRADEPGEMLGYWKSQVGGPIPSRVKRGVADAVQRLYSERNLLAYDGQGRGWRFGDVIEVVHPTPIAPWQSALFKYALDRRRHDAEGSEHLPLIGAAMYAEKTPVDQRRAHLKRGLLAGFNWERLAGWLPGGMDAEAWEAIIPQMGVMALVRNLNNFDRAGISRASQEAVMAKITSPEDIRKSRMMPFRFLTAYKALEADTYKVALGAAMETSRENIPLMLGATLIMVDCSGSMSNPVGAGKSRQPLRLSELAGFMAETLARRCEHARIVCYSNTIRSIHRPGSHISVVRAASDACYTPNGGTNTWQSTAQAFEGENRIVIITDEQAHDRDSGNIRVPIVTWNLAGYQAHHANHGKPNRYLISGVNDTALQVLPSLIARADGRWPWE